MNIRNAACTTALLVLTVGVSLSADRIRLRSGKAIDGIFIGGDSKSVRMLLDSGQVSEARLEDVVAIEVSARKPAPPPPPPPKPAAAHPPRHPPRHPSRHPSR